MYGDFVHSNSIYRGWRLSPAVVCNPDDPADNTDLILRVEDFIMRVHCGNLIDESGVRPPDFNHLYEIARRYSLSAI